MIEELTGRPYAEVVQERVFDRAGMDASGFFRMDEALPDVAVGYLPRADASPPWRSNVYSMPVVGGADGGAFSTVGDLDRFLRAYADGTLLGDLREVVLTPHTDAEDGFHEGYGVHLYPDGRYGHGGGDPGVDVLVHRWPDDDVHLVALCNMEGLVVEVRDLMVEAWRGLELRQSRRVGAPLGQLLETELDLPADLADLLGVLALGAPVDRRADPVERPVDVVAVLVGEIGSRREPTLHDALGLVDGLVEPRVEVELVDLLLQRLVDPAHRPVLTGFVTAPPW